MPHCRGVMSRLKKGRPLARPASETKCGCLPAGAHPAGIWTMAQAPAGTAAAPAIMTATATPTPVTAPITAAAAPTPVLHGLDRARSVRGIANHGAVDRGGRYAGSASKPDAGSDQHCKQGTTHFAVSSPR